MNTILPGGEGSKFLIEGACSFGAWRGRNMDGNKISIWVAINVSLYNPITQIILIKKHFSLFNFTFIERKIFSTGLSKSDNKIFNELPITVTNFIAKRSVKKNYFAKFQTWETGLFNQSNWIGSYYRFYNKIIFLFITKLDLTNYIL